MFGIVRRDRFLRRMVAKVASDTLDPTDWQAIAIGGADARPVLYIPIPKAANTSIRTALKPCFGLAGEVIANVHQDSRIDKRSLRAGLAAAPVDAMVFTVVRHPALRIRSTFRNKLGWRDASRPLGIKRRFGHAANLGIPRGASFEEFLSILAQTPEWALDSHFKPQAALLRHALADPRLELFRFETINADWPGIAARIAARVPVAPDGTLEYLNATGRAAPVFSVAERRLIELIYRADFETFGYSWDDLGAGV